MKINQHISNYISKWINQGYPKGIPEEIPLELFRENLAPSYKGIALSILSNDFHLTKLGESNRPTSRWYSVLKKIELQETLYPMQLTFNFLLKKELPK
jgi:predicted phosphoadenosine phosphosulfate sulfurtransferase